MDMAFWKGEARKMADFERHIRACNNAVLPGRRLPFRLAGAVVGYVRPETPEALQEVVRREDGVDLPDAAALPGLARKAADIGLCPWRGEAFDVRSNPEGPVLSTIDRGALPLFGIQATGVHVNGLVHRPDGLHVWVARRARDTLLDPSKLDHVVAGGVPAGLTPWQTLIKEAQEEAAIPADIAREAVETSRISYAMERPEGLRRDMLICYDLRLPEDFTPVPVDGEVEAFELWPIAKAAETVLDTEDFKFNVNLVLIDLFRRQGLI